MGTHSADRTAAILGRWQPVHLGHVAALSAICEQFDHVQIGIGSSNTHDYRNPFQPKDVESMLLLPLESFDNYELIPIPDIEDDAVWCREIKKKIGEPDVFFTANPYVFALLNEDFYIAHPASVIPDSRKTPVSATLVRKALARGEGWEAFLPASISRYILENRLDVRFRQNFGLQTLMMETVVVN